MTKRFRVVIICYLVNVKHKVDVDGMEGVVETGSTFMARREVVPTVVEADAITVQQVEIPSNVSTKTRKPLDKGLIILKKRVGLVDIARVIIHVGVSRSDDQSRDGQVQFAVDREEVVRTAANEGEIILQHPFCAKVLEDGSTPGGVQ